MACNDYPRRACIYGFAIGVSGLGSLAVSAFWATFAYVKSYMEMETTRQNKISRLLQKELSEMFERQTRMTHGLIVSVSKCRISPDLSVCTSYLSVFPPERASEIVGNINANARTIRYELGKRVRFQLRIIPELRFFVDDSLEYIKHIDELLAKDAPKKPSDDAPAQAPQQK